MPVKKEWWRGGVIYQVYPRSFFDSNGDGIGDLKGITQKLDYIASLGVDGVWISPFFTSPMKDFGYDVSDYRDIDPIFGTLADFDEMLAEMHKRGLKLVIDLVLSHSSEKHPWFQESRKSRDNAKADWYVWADPKPDGTPPNNWMSNFGGPAWTFDTRRGQYYYHQFLKEQPDLNVQNPAVQDALLDILAFWLDRGVDGFRLDALNHCMHDPQLRDNPPSPTFDRSQKGTRTSHPYFWQRHLHDKTQPEMIPFIERLRALTDRYDDRMMVAEVGDDFQTQTCVAYTDGPKRLHTAYSFSMLVPHAYSATALRAIIEDYIGTPGDSWPAWAFSNHDSMRVISRWTAGDGNLALAQAKMLIALLTSFRGTAFLYQGEELGLPEADIPFEKLQDPYGIFLWPEDKGRDGCRTPMPWVSQREPDGWLPIPDAHLPLSVEAQQKNADSVLSFTRAFLQWRKKYPALVTGAITFHDAAEPVLAFSRSIGDQDMFCAFNLGAADAAVSVPDGYAVLADSGFDTATVKDGQLPAFGAVFGLKNRD